MEKTSPASNPRIRRILLASFIGTAVEYYDFYIYVTAASIIFGPLFFPSSSSSLQLLYSYASFGLAFLVRPLGGAVFGHFGDRIGRKSTLVISLLMMGGATMMIGILPTYASIGWWAPFLLCMLRVLQGFGLGGEWGGASLLAIENAPPGWRARFAIFPQLGAPIGFFCGNGLFLLMGQILTDAQFRAWGWRLPFLLSLLLIGIGLWARLTLTETSAFAKAAEKEAPAKVPMLDLFRNHAGQALAGTLAVVASYALFYVATAFLLGEATTVLGFDKQSILLIQLVGILFMAGGIIIAGCWADRINPRNVLLLGCLGAAIVGGIIQPLLGSGSLALVVVFVIFSLSVMGLIFGPGSTWLSQLFPARVRYTGIALCYNVGSILGGGLTPIAAKALADWGGLQMVGYYLAAAALLSVCAIIAGDRIKQPSAPGD